MNIGGINSSVLMSGTQYFAVKELNPYSDSNIQPDVSTASKEHKDIQSALESAGVEIINVPPPEYCQDGVYTANWALCRGNTAIMSSLPNMRKAEEPYAEQTLKKHGKKVIKAPYKFSGQGDALPCGDMLFAGSAYRTDVRMHNFIKDTLGYKVISLQTVAALDGNGQASINHLTGWPDSFFYDIDLALAIISPDLIAWCPEAFVPSSQDLISSLDIKKITVSLKEAKEGFACNLVSTSETVIMSKNAPLLKANLENYGLKVITPSITELAKGGGYIRCTTLTLDNL